MADQLIIPRQSWSEKFKDQVKNFSPQVKQGLIGAAVTLLIAISGCVAVYLKTPDYGLKSMTLKWRYFRSEILRATIQQG